MNLILYLSGRHADEERLRSAVESATHGLEVKTRICKTLAELAMSLRRLSSNLAAVVLLAADGCDLQSLLSIRGQLSNARILLVLADADKASTVKAHTLRPRFMTSTDGDFSDVVAVLGKMLAYQSVEQKKILKEWSSVGHRSES